MNNYDFELAQRIDEYEIKHIYYGHKSRKRGDNVRDI